ncbi:flavin reductase family protein [Enterovibrio sp. ZSDZ35]|uniref:Flavin reductase family protein n=1 Tax=Enterovibrio qingdaonensis TaxID=2899818 RepID=A0ABT5QQ46_9GAMM|nr:flavin reductase family protein [Enterovibrio sp. ZSDZ35]MDD1783116.1 flavin reductase family protein [Enterovibrio sp. ZSDZ35]
MHFNLEELGQLEDRYRAKLINSLSGFKSANLIGTTDGRGNHNLAIVSSVFHIGANPPLVGMIIRPHTVTRDTLENILELGEYTINQVNADIWKESHQTSARYEQLVSEFTEAGLTPEWLDGVKAPFVAESRLKYSLLLRESQTLEINGTVLVIGEINNVLLEDEVIADDGYIDIEALETVAVSGLDSYHVTNRLGRLNYAKPDKKAGVND